MTDIVVALIAMLGTVAAALLPKWFEMRGASKGPFDSKPIPLATIIVIAIFVFVGVWAAHDRATVNSSSATQTSFFLGVAGIASALLGHSAVSHHQHLGMYVGYVSAVVAALFLLWSVLIHRPDDEYIQAYAISTTIAICWTLWLFWKPFILKGIAEKRRLREQHKNDI